MSKTVLAFDFGASSGRAILALYKNGDLTYKEIHRFENVPRDKDGHFRWNFKNLMSNVYEGIEKAGSFDSIGFDTWGVDYGLLDENGDLIADPVHYRDERTNGGPEKAFDIMPASQLYELTGNQIMNINTLFQILSESNKSAKKLLFMPDLFAYMLCKNAVCEKSIASTSQMMDPNTGEWSDKVIKKFNINSDMLAPIVSSGTIVGEYKGAKVISVAGHDTQCAVAALPTNDENMAFLSCGTWSLLGTELDAPILTEKSRMCDLSNEIGANGKINYLKNIIGLWLIQESRREWKRQGHEYGYADLERFALEALPFRCFIDPDSPEFTPPGDIPSRIQRFCGKTGQYIPQTVGEIMRCIYESLALKYRFTLCQLGEVTQKKFDALHILGGGTKDTLLCRMTADCCSIPVFAGPIEATALGNIIIQLAALGEISDIEQGRDLIRKIEKIASYIPDGTSNWDEAFKSYNKILKIRY